MATKRTKWKGWITLTRGNLGEPVTHSPVYEFVCAGGDQAFDVAEDQLRHLWENAGRPVAKDGYDPTEQGLFSYPNLEAVGPADPLP